MSEFKSYRKESKADWGITNGSQLSLEQLKAGAILRIADATEVMAQNHVQMQKDLERYKRWYNEECERVRYRDKRIAALKGVITKLKKRTK